VRAVCNPCGGRVESIVGAPLRVGVAQDGSVVDLRGQTKRNTIKR